MAFARSIASGTLQPPRWTHEKGLTSLCYSEDGANLITAGSDGLIRIYPADLAHRDDEANTIDWTINAVHCLASSGKVLAVGTEDCSVGVFSIPDGKFTKLALRTSLPVRCIDIDRAGTKVAVASDEVTVKIIDLEDITKVVTLTGHARAIRHVAFSSTGDYISSVGSDGTVKIWSLSQSVELDPESPGAECVATLENCMTPEHTAGRLARMTTHWNPTGRLLAVPTKTFEIALYGEGSWTQVGFLQEDGHSAAISIVAWSPSGRYLVSVTAEAKSELLLWDAESRTVMLRHRHDVTITDLEWNTSRGANSIAWQDSDGQMTFWDDVVAPNLPAPGRSTRVINQPTNFVEKEAKSVDIEAASLASEEEDDDDLGSLQDFLDNDDGKPVQRPVRQIEPARPTIAKVPSFQPGSTPWRNKRRYLDFNLLGTITAVEQDGHNLITVEYYDRSSHRGSNFVDHFLYDKGSLCEKGSFYSCPSLEGNPSTLYYKGSETWATSTEWQYPLGLQEDCHALATNLDGSCAAATSKGWIRFFASSGLQTQIIWRDNVVCLAGGDGLFLAITRAGASTDSHTLFDYTLFSGSKYAVTQEGRLPIASGSRPEWIGFSDLNLPILYDSTGVLSILERSHQPRQGRWLPIMDTAAQARKEGRQERYWPVGLVGQKLMCLILKGNETSPSFPRPIIHELDIQMPLLNMDNKTGQLEEQYLREQLFKSVWLDRLSIDEQEQRTREVREKHIATDKLLLQVIQLACKSDRLQRALDATAELDLCFDQAGQIAAFFHLPGLQERMQLVRDRIMAERSEDRELETRMERPVPTATQSTLTSSMSAPFGTRQASSRLLRETPEAESDLRPTQRAPSEVLASQEPEDTFEAPRPRTGIPVLPTPAVPTTSSNPFAKKAGAAAPPAPSLASGKVPLRKSSSSSSSTVSRSNSFFERVDSRQKDKGESKDQRTLFGLVDVNKRKRVESKEEPSAKRLGEGGYESEEWPSDLDDKENDAQNDKENLTPMSTVQV